MSNEKKKLFYLPAINHVNHDSCLHSQHENISQLLFPVHSTLNLSQLRFFCLLINHVGNATYKLKRFLLSCLQEMLVKSYYWLWMLDESLQDTLI